MPNWGMCWPLKKRARVDEVVPEAPEVVVEFFGRKSGGLVATAEGEVKDAPVTFDLVDVGGGDGEGVQVEAMAIVLRGGEDIEIEGKGEAGDFIDFTDAEEVPGPELKSEEGGCAEVKVENGESMETGANVEEKSEDEDNIEVPEPELKSEEAEHANGAEIKVENGEMIETEANVEENEEDEDKVEVPGPELKSEGESAEVKVENGEVMETEANLKEKTEVEDKDEVPEPELNPEGGCAEVKVENGERMETEASVEEMAENEVQNEVPGQMSNSEEGGGASAAEVNVEIGERMETEDEDNIEVSEPELKSEEGGDASGAVVKVENETREMIETEVNVEEKEEDDKDEVPEPKLNSEEGDVIGAEVKVENGERMETEAEEEKAEDEDDLKVLDLISDSFPEDKAVIFEVTCVYCWEPCPPLAGVTCHFGHSLCLECRDDLALDPESPKVCPALFVIKQEEGEQEEAEEQEERDWDAGPDVPAQEMCTAELHQIDLEVQAAPYFKHFMENSKYSCGAKVFGCKVELPGHSIGNHEKTDCLYRFNRHCGFQKDGCTTLFKCTKHMIYHLFNEHNVPFGFRNEGHFLVRYDREEYFDNDQCAIKPLIRAMIESRNQHSLYFLMVDDLQTEDGKVARIWVANAFPEQNKKRDREIVAKIAITSNIRFDGKRQSVFRLMEGEIPIATVPSLQTLGENLIQNFKKEIRDDRRIYYVDVPHEDLDEIAMVEGNKKYFNLMIMICVDTDLPLTVDDFVDEDEPKALRLAGLNVDGVMDEDLTDMEDDDEDTGSDDLAEYV